MADSLADLFVSLTADTSDFQKSFQDAASLADASLQAIEDAASAAGQGVADGLQAGVAGLEALSAKLDETASSVTEASSQMDLFGSALDGVPFADAAGQLNLFTDELETIPQAAGSAVSSLQDLSEAQSQVTESAGEAESALGSMREQLLEFGEALAITEGLHEFGVEALQTFGSVQKASIALTAMTDSAETAEETISSLKTLSIQTATSFESLVGATQAMTAKFQDTGISGEQIHDALLGAADAAAATGGSFDRVDSSIQRLVLSGTAGARQLAALGLSLNDLAAQMVSTSTGLELTSDDAAAAFKSLDATDRLTVLTQALEKYGDVAAATAQGIIGQWQNLKTQTEFVFEGIGEALAPVVGQLLSLVSSDVLPAIQDLVNDFNQLPTPVKDAAVALGLFVAALAPVAVGLAGFGLLVTGLNAALPALGALLTVGAGELTALGAAAVVASAAFSATVWGGIIVSVGLLAKGLYDLSVANASLESSTKQQQDSLSKSEIMLRQQGVDISDLTTAYNQGTISQDSYTRSLIAMQLALGSLKNPAIPNDVMSGVQGGPKLPALTAAQTAAEAIAQAQAELDALMAQMQGPLQGGPGASSGPMLAPGTGITPDQFDILQNSAAALNDMQTEAAALSGDLQDAEDNETSLFDTAQSLKLEYQQLPGYIDAVKNAWDAANAGGAAQAEADARKLADAFLTLHISADDASKFMVTSFETIAQSAKTTLPQVEAAWSAISGAISKLSKNDLPAAVSAYNDYIDALQRTGAPLGEILKADEALLALEIKLASERGEDATDFIEQLQNEKLAAQKLTDQSQALGNVYVSLTNEFNGAFTALGKGIADNIVDAKNWGQAFGAIINTIEKQILETLIGYGFKQLALAIQSSTNLMGGLAKVITDVLSGNFSGALADLKTIGPGQNPASIYSSPIGPAPAPGSVDPALPPNTAAVTTDTTAVNANTPAVTANTAAEGTNTTALGTLTAAILALTAASAVNAITGVLGLLNKPPGAVTSTIGPVQPGDENGTPVQPASPGEDESINPSDGGIGSSATMMTSLGLQAMAALSLSMEGLQTATTASTGVIQIATTAQNIAAGNVIQMTSAVQTATDSTIKFSDITEDGLNGVEANTAAILPDTSAITDNSTALSGLTGDIGSMSKDLASIPTGGAGGASLPGGGSGGGSGVGGSESGSVPMGGADGGSSSLVSSLGGISGIANIVGAVAAIGSGITAGIQAEHANNLLDEIEKSTRGELNQTIDIQTALNQYLPEMDHLVDIWGAINTMYQGLDEDLRNLASAANQSGNRSYTAGPGDNPSAPVGTNFTPPTNSDVQDNTDALHTSTLTASNLRGGIDKLGSNLQDFLAHMPGNVTASSNGLNPPPNNTVSYSPGTDANGNVPGQNLVTLTLPDGRQVSVYANDVGTFLNNLGSNPTGAATAIGPGPAAPAPAGASIQDQNAALDKWLAANPQDSAFGTYIDATGKEFVNAGSAVSVWTSNAATASTSLADLNAQLQNTQDWLESLTASGRQVIGNALTGYEIPGGSTVSNASPYVYSGTGTPYTPYNAPNASNYSLGPNAPNPGTINTYTPGQPNGPVSTSLTVIAANNTARAMTKSLVTGMQQLGVSLR